MVDHESQFDSSIRGPVRLPLPADEGSTIAAASTALPKGQANEHSGGLPDDSSARSKGDVNELKSAASFPPLGSPASGPMLTDKTVISKRPPLETPFPILPTSQSLGQALIGTTLDHYDLVEFVGGGGMGAVFRSIDTRLGRTVAVKVLSRDHTDEETIKRFRNEAQSAARLDHPNIARVYFVGEAEGWNYIVFEYIEGTNLRDIVEARGPLPLEEALNYTLQVTEAIDHASNRDVVHRDIKPSNVLVTPSGVVKLVDMGLARLHQVESTSEDLTASGVMLGTFDYISPEQARDPRSADVRSDIYSLGCTLYFMLAGRPPFPEGTAVQKLLKHNSEEPPDLRLFQPDLPQPVSALVSRMLAKRPTQRQQNPRELSSEIQSLAQQLGLSRLAQQSGIGQPAVAGRRSFWSRMLPILVPTAALIMALLVIDTLSRQGEKPLAVVQRPKLESPLITEDSIDREGSDSPDDAVPPPADPGTTQSPAEAPAVKGGEPSRLKPAVTGNGSGATAESSSAPLKSQAIGDEGELHAVVTAGDSRSVPGEDGNGRLSAAEEEFSGQLSDRPAGDEIAIARRPVISESSNQLPAITRVIVRPDGQTTADDAQVVGTLARACQVAAERGVSEIELQFSGPREEQPFDLSLSKARIFAGVGFRPVIVFRPQPSSSERDQQMIRLIGGSRSQVIFENVELSLELPGVPSSSGGWALLALYQIQTLELRDSVLTVKDSAGSLGSSVHDQVGMLALQPHRPAETMKMMDDMMAMLPSINVNLTNCIARGEATFLLANEERPLTLTWEQGLLVTPQRLLDSGGSTLTKPNPQDKFQIELKHVTAIVPAGLVRQNRNGMPSQQRLEVHCISSVLAVDEGNFLFDFAGLNSREDIKLDFDGDKTLYPQRAGRFLRAQTTRNDVEEVMEARDWPHGRDSGAGIVTWLNNSQPPSLAEKPAHQQVVGDYQLDAQSAPGGFDREAMRNVADAAATPEASDLPVTGGADDFSD